MNRRKGWWVLLILLLVLVVPIPTGTNKDGGTRAYTALTYKIVHWHRLVDAQIYEKTNVYPFPLNLWPIDRLWARENVHVEVSCAPEPSSQPQPTVQVVPSQEVRCTYDVLEIILSIPEGWEYRESCFEAEGYGGNSIRFWPENNEEFATTVELASSFGVCGTELKTEEGVLAGRPARLGYYDGKDMWSFITVSDLPIACAIRNDGIGNAPAQTKNAAMDILNTLQILQH